MMPEFYRGQKDIVEFLTQFGASTWKTVKRWQRVRDLPIEYDDDGKPILFEDEFFTWQRERVGLS